MRGWIGGICLLAAFAAHAGSGTLRVGSQVLVVGDSAARVVDLLGKPSYKTHAKSSTSGHAKGSRKGARSHASPESGGEQWQYHDGRRTVTIIMVDGRVSAIRDGER